MDLDRVVSKYVRRYKSETIYTVTLYPYRLECIFYTTDAARKITKNPNADRIVNLPVDEKLDIRFVKGGLLQEPYWVISHIEASETPILIHFSDREASICDDFIDEIRSEMMMSVMRGMFTNEEEEPELPSGSIEPEKRRSDRDLTSQIEKAGDLYAKGILSDEEFKKVKEKIIGDTQ